MYLGVRHLILFDFGTNFYIWIFVLLRQIFLVYSEDYVVSDDFDSFIILFYSLKELIIRKSYFRKVQMIHLPVEII